MLARLSLFFSLKQFFLLLFEAFSTSFRFLFIRKGSLLELYLSFARRTNAVFVHKDSEHEIRRSEFRSLVRAGREK